MIGDVRDDRLVRKAMRRVDCVYHLAGAAAGYRGDRSRRGPHRERPGHPQRARGGRRPKVCGGWCSRRARPSTARQRDSDRRGPPGPAGLGVRRVQARGRDLLPGLPRVPTPGDGAPPLLQRLRAAAERGAPRAPSCPPSSRRSGAGAVRALAGDGRARPGLPLRRRRGGGDRRRRRQAPRARAAARSTWARASSPRPLEMLGILNRLLRYRRRAAAGPAAHGAAVAAARADIALAGRAARAGRRGCRS